MGGVGAGLAAGVLSGLFGLGGGLVLVPFLGLAMGLDQHASQGVTLAVMLLPIGLPAVLAYHRAQKRWNRFWCREPHHPELAAYAKASPEEQEAVRRAVGAPDDPRGLDPEEEGWEEVRQAWYAFWVSRSEGLRAYLGELKEIEGEDVGQDIETAKGRLIRRKVAARRKLAAKPVVTMPSRKKQTAKWKVLRVPAAPSA